jgi:integrase/recombinase XerC
MAELTGFSAAQGEALARWLAHLSALDGASEKTVQAYGRDLRGFLAFLSQHHGAGEGLGALDALPHTDLRAWMAAERGRGLSARSLARSLSAVKNFLGWLSQQHSRLVVCSRLGAERSDGSRKARGETIRVQVWVWVWRWRWVDR